MFYLQARQADELVSLKLEKEQVLFLAGGLSEVMADLAAPTAIPDETELELEEPVLPAWSVGSMQLAYDSTADRVVLVAREIVPTRRATRRKRDEWQRYGRGRRGLLRGGCDLAGFGRGTA